MIKTLLKYKWHIIVILALIIIEPSINAILNFWLQRLFNTTEPGGNVVELLRILTVGFLLWMLKRVVGFASGTLRTHFICKAKMDIRCSMFTNIMSLDTANLTQTASSGECISIFTNDILWLEQRFYQQIISLVSNVFSIVILGGSFIALNLKLGLAISAFGFVAMIVPAMLSRRLDDKSSEYSRTVSRFTQKLKEYFVAYPTIKNYAIEGAIVERFNDENKKTEGAKFEADHTLNLANNVGTLLAWFMQFIAVGLGLMMVVNGELLIGTVLAAQSFASDLAAPLQNVIFNINSIRSVREIVKKVEKLSTNNDEMNIGEQMEEPKELKNTTVTAEHYDIVFDNLYLSLGEKEIIDHFSFCFESGKKYLIVGLNGSGKSSLFRTLKKWFSDYEGKVTIGGRDISLLDNDEISAIVSYLNENVVLFSGTVQENIQLFRNSTKGMFEYALNAAQVKLDLNRRIIDEGRNVSSGECRRIEIARSLLESVKVLIFDEVVSTLDIETAYEIEKLSLGLKDQTVIFISHNFSGKLIREYDKILVMDAGRLLDSGTYEELMGRCEYFRRICEIKFG